MNCSNSYRVPSRLKRILAVWYRHERVYNADLISNAFPPVLEPLILLAGLGVGFGAYIQTMGNMSYLLFLSTGILVTTAMFTAAYECTYSTFIRLEYDGVYDGMLGAPLAPEDLIIGELLFAGYKGMIFTLAVLAVTWIAGIIRSPMSILVLPVGFLCGGMFGALSMWVTSLIKNINHFNFYISGIITPMFFFSGAVFPLESLPGSLQMLCQAFPLTHVVNLARGLCVPGMFRAGLVWDLLYCIIFCLVTSLLAIRGLRKRLID